MRYHNVQVLTYNVAGHVIESCSYQLNSDQLAEMAGPDFLEPPVAHQWVRARSAKPGEEAQWCDVFVDGTLKTGCDLG